jgi:hypothetical protein
MFTGWTLLTNLPEWASLVGMGFTAITLAVMLRPARRGDA